MASADTLSITPGTGVNSFANPATAPLDGETLYRVDGAGNYLSFHNADNGYLGMAGLFPLQDGTFGDATARSVGFAVCVEPGIEPYPSAPLSSLADGAGKSGIPIEKVEAAAKIMQAITQTEEMTFSNPREYEEVMIPGSAEPVMQPKWVLTGEQKVYPTKINPLFLGEKYGLAQYIHQNFWSAAAQLAVWNILKPENYGITKTADGQLEVRGGREEYKPIASNKVVDLQRTMQVVNNGNKLEEEPIVWGGFRPPTNEEFYRMYEILQEAAAAPSAPFGVIDVAIDAAKSSAVENGDKVDLKLVFPTPKSTSAIDYHLVVNGQDSAPIAPSSTTESNGETTLTFTGVDKSSASDYYKLTATGESLSSGYVYSPNSGDFGQDIVTNQFAKYEHHAYQPFTLEYEETTTTSPTPVESTTEETTTTSEEPTTSTTEETTTTSEEPTTSTTEETTTTSEEPTTSTTVVTTSSTEPTTSTQVVPVEKKMKTTVEANGEASSAEKAVTVSVEAAKSGVAVVDTIDYSGFEAGKTYTFFGSLVDVTDGNKVVAVAATTQVVASVDGSVKVDFGTLTNLQEGHKYVVFERAYEGAVEVPSEVPSVDNGGDEVPGVSETPVVVHADGDDTAQTVVVDSVKKMKTTVEANGEASSADKAVTVSVEAAKAGVAVVDTIDYSGFEAGKTYTFLGSLVDVTENNKVVAVAATTQVVASADGSVKVDFGTLTNLQEGHKYVVFERAYEGTVEVPSEVPSVDNGGNEVPGVSETPVVVHADGDDTAQTVVVDSVKKMKTTVEANGEASSAEKAVTVSVEAAKSGVAVVDTIDYSGFEAGKTYTFLGSLVDVTDGNKVVAVAATTQVVASADGSVKVDFGTLTNLQEGHKYVVFERAYEGAVEVPSEVPSVDNGGNEVPGVSETPVVVHADGDDTAQTVVIDTERIVPGSSKWWLLIPIVPAVIGGIAALAGGSSAPVEVPVAPTTAPAPETVKVPSKGVEKRPMLAQTGANVLWVVLAGLIAAIAGGLLITRRKNA